MNAKSHAMIAHQLTKGGAKQAQTRGNHSDVCDKKIGQSCALTNSCNVIGNMGHEANAHGKASHMQAGAPFSPH
jgi:hypothetical protein